MKEISSLIAYRPDVKVVDATLRDGGLVNDFYFDDAFVKALYLATHEIAKKWTVPLRNWGRVLGELEIMYPDRLA